MTILTIGTATHEFIEQQVEWYARNATWLNQEFDAKGTKAVLYMVAARLTTATTDGLKAAYYSLDHTTHKMAKALLIDNGEWKA